MFSIDQNCHSLWDVVPKLHALAAHERFVTHFVEDVDAAFTQIGSSPDDARLRLARERFYRSGGADWGAALFYSEFLGRLPVEIRDWEPLTGLKTAALAHQLDRTGDDLYDEFSPGDNWQLIGPSYVGDRDHHRIIGDLSVAETAPFLRELLDKARTDMLRSFPERAAQQRLTDWLDQEARRLDDLLDQHAEGLLVELYQDWLSQYVQDMPSIGLDLGSRLFAVGSHRTSPALLDLFLRDYDAAVGLYNEAVDETDTGLRALKTSAGELPFFAALTHQGHAVRCGVFLRDGVLEIGGRSFPLGPGGEPPLGALREGGVRCLAGKAAVLVLQVRLRPVGEPLALPYHGSIYMPAANRLAAKLAQRELLPGPVEPIVRVRFRLLERMRPLKTIIRLPDHLARAFGTQEITAERLAEDHADLARAAAERMESFRTEQGRLDWQRANCAEALARVDGLDARRRQLAQRDPKGPEIRDTWKQIKAIQIEVLSATLRQIADDHQTSRIDYWDSRGALLPWCIALGGREFYDDLIRQSEVYEEPGS